MDGDKRARLVKLLKVFQYAVAEEKKAQELYHKCREDYGDNADYAALFDWLCNQEVRHEEALKEKYAVLKKILETE